MKEIFSPNYKVETQLTVPVNPDKRIINLRGFTKEAIPTITVEDLGRGRELFSPTDDDTEWMNRTYNF